MAHYDVVIVEIILSWFFVFVTAHLLFFNFNVIFANDFLIWQ